MPHVQSNAREATDGPYTHLITIKYKIMKRLFSTLLVFIFLSGNLLATGTGTITILNGTDFTATVYMFASAPTSCSGYACDATYGTNAITIPYFSNWGAYTPCNVSSSPGWSFASCSTSWCSSLPSDFQWTEAVIFISYGSGLGPLYLSYSRNCISPGPCNGYRDSYVYSSVFGSSDRPNLSIDWSGGCGGMADVTITLTQY